jgi:hypothetical protein
MNQFFNVLLSALRARITGLWTMLRLMVNPTFWATRGVTILRSFFARLFNIKPKHKHDYYPVFRWLVSKRLAFALVVVLGAVGLWYIFSMSPLLLHVGAAESTIPSYRYRSPALKFHDGEVRILDAADKEAYVGAVSGGRANGQGRLFDAQGALLYAGAFKDSMYEGQGEAYHPNGAVRYKGDFSRNLFHGQGSYFRQEGTLEYEGEYVNGVRQGSGILCDAGGNKIYEGHFQMNRIVYEEFVGKTAPDAAALYSGESVTYVGDGEYCVDMSEINAVYAARSGAESLDEEWKIERVYVLSDSIPLGGKDLTTINEVSAALGEPSYSGETWLVLSDSVAANLSRQEQIVPVDMELEEPFEDVRTVVSYDGNRQMYIYVFENDGFVYTFYSENGGSAEFFMYSAE